MKRLIVLFCVVFLTACDEKTVIDHDALTYMQPKCDVNGGVDNYLFTSREHILTTNVAELTIYCMNGAIFHEKVSDIKRNMEKQNNE